jgi:hypothetical protein
VGLMAEYAEAIVSWRSLIVALVIFGFAPGFVLRPLVKVVGLLDLNG